MAIHIKKSHRGLLRKNLGVPQGQPIPAGRLETALDSASAKLRKQAQFAKNAKSWNR